MQFHRLRRRDLITLLGGAAWPLAARAQPKRMGRIGVLVGAADDPEMKTRLAAFRQGLEKRGWSEGRNVLIDFRYAPVDDVDQTQVMAKELVALQPDVILSSTFAITTPHMQMDAVIVSADGPQQPIAATVHR
jgi:putative ABC transport system substrate-binding protein